MSKISVRELNTSIKGIKIRITNKMNKLQTAQRVLGKMRADHRSTKSRLIRTVSDRIKAPKEQLTKEAKQPDRLAYQIGIQQKKVIKLKQELAILDQELVELQKRLRKQLRKKERAAKKAIKKEKKEAKKANPGD